MINDGDFDIWVLKWYDNGRLIEIYKYLGLVYKKIFWNIIKKDCVLELIYNMINNSNYDFINMYYIYVEILWFVIGIRLGLLEVFGLYFLFSSVLIKLILKLLLYFIGLWSILYIVVYYIILLRIIVMGLN